MLKFIIFAFLFSFYANSVGAFILPEKYRSGIEICLENKKLQVGEIPKWVEVPVNYSNPDGEKTFIYSYTKKPFNPNLPSVIYFTGGPGVSSRNTEFDLPKTNVIFFEQRGISCSRPKRRELFLDPKFYSSLNTVYDAKLILDSFGVKSAAIYGQSYGTVPATMFASILPERSKSLILEGVIYEANKSLWNSKVKKKLLQSYFNNLSEDKQNRILGLSKGGQLPANWFSKLTGMVLYLNDGIEIMDTFISNVLSMDEESIKNFVMSFYPVEKLEDEYSFGDVMMGMIGCQELSMNDPDLSITLEFRGSELVYDRDNEDYVQRCKPLGLTHLDNTHYRAINFPVYVPTIYLLGENDGATDIEQGAAHFKNVAKGQKTIMLMKRGGHMPSLSLLKDDRECDSTIEDCLKLKQNNLMTKIFEVIVDQSQVPMNLIEEFNQFGPLEWSIQ